MLSYCKILLIFREDKTYLKFFSQRDIYKQASHRQIYMQIILYLNIKMMLATKRAVKINSAYYDDVTHKRSR